MNMQKVAAVIALGTAFAMPAMAQSSTATQSGQSTAGTQSVGASPSDMRRVERDDGFDMGWLGLLGLAGLIGLRRNKGDHIRHGTDNRATGTGR